MGAGKKDCLNDSLYNQTFLLFLFRGSAVRRLSWAGISALFNFANEIPSYMLQPEEKNTVPISNGELFY